ncbi:RNA exonuclease 3 [Coccidioides posadasii str. Silveira]|uniref:RNA exonuclease 3 n=2 Tax=Coccidioides posadasii TaxID=199306 RepID=E9CYL4_COCPS|nr:exonuclease family protein [Coccidioides posadasii C735 delta SOWgp]EER27064.1 exonuclease family protein [Coccidioides posadasii C735 delta SOWgp]EFW21041.1 RNA exonuclease 3 [Coccidioides posadasii str. Silveira]QVM08000.1 RNA exonuclease 3 [Coccidioides posadasii str. Silveira]|eukprot:XP_003069209.1 exonuclease family protein [Coccidioides posadasii C735 delta SOWgp]
MFNSVGFFKAVSCPEGTGCKLLNCMFAHEDKETSSFITPKSTNEGVVLNADATYVNEEPLPKKRRLDADGHSTLKPVDKAKRHGTSPNNSIPNLDPQINEKEKSSNEIQGLTSVSKPVSPSISRHTSPHGHHRPPVGSQNQKPSDTTSIPVSTQPRQVKKETLNPRHLSKPPAAHSTRASVLAKLHEEMVRLNNQLLALKEQSRKALVLSEDELISRALDEEEKAARESSSVYSNVIKLRITKLRKMKLSDWEEDVLNYLRPKNTQVLPLKPQPEPILTGLDVQGEIVMLSRFLASPEAQAKAGYVIVAPSKEDIKNATKGNITAQGWEQCDRCSGRFQVFPGRREDGLLASGGPCTYHHARLVRPPKKKTDHILGQTEPYFPCCNEAVGTSAGCTKAESHVFKVTEVKRLAAILQFEKTPAQPDKGLLPPICFDCEMGYTTLGLELIRLTAITWPDQKKVLDVLVRPMGEVLDLNSRYSGVRPEHFANAVPYGSEQARAQASSGPQSVNFVLPIVESPAAARALLFEHLQPDTPVIGHAIDNDLNACRIIHPTIVDTVLLYPHPGGLPYRFGLRTLSKKYLDRHIQAAGDQGHDSMEDAKATGDLVRVKVRETWTRLKALGYTIKDGALIEPEPNKVNIKPFAAGTAALGIGAGSKRTSYDQTKEAKA